MQLEFPAFTGGHFGLTSPRSMGVACFGIMTSNRLRCCFDACKPSPILEISGKQKDAEMFDDVQFWGGKEECLNRR